MLPLLSYCLESLRDRLGRTAFGVMWTLLRFLATKCLLVFCSTLKSVSVLSAKEQYSSAVLLFETSHMRLLFLDPIVVVLSVQETQDSAVPFPHAGSVRSERRKTAGGLLLGIKRRWWKPGWLGWGAQRAVAAAEHGLSHREGGTGGLLIPGRVEIHAVCSEQGEGCRVALWSALVLQSTIWAFIYRNSCIAHRRPALSPSWQPFERNLQ